MKKKQELLTKASEPDKVDAYMQKLKHPLKEVVAALRQTILSTDPEIGEEIKWNAPTFFYAGEMKPSDPKKYKRYMIVFNLYQKDCIRLVFPSGAKINDRSGFCREFPHASRDAVPPYGAAQHTLYALAGKSPPSGS